MSNSLDPDQEQHNVGPDLNLYCLQWLSSAKKETAARNELMLLYIIFSGMLRTTRQYLQYMGYLGRHPDDCTSEVKAPMMGNMKLFLTFRSTVLKST